MKLQGIEQGDIVEVFWRDILESIDGDPRRAKLARRTSLGRFWEIKDDEGIDVLVTTNTIDKDVEGQEGYVVYPLSLVKIKLIKKGRKRGSSNSRSSRKGDHSHPGPSGAGVAMAGVEEGPRSKPSGHPGLDGKVREAP